jgi:hypothetical protein
MRRVARASHAGAEVEWRAVKRRLFSILSAISLLLFVAVVVLWVRSFWRWESISYQSHGGIYTVGSAAGDLIVICIAYEGRFSGGSKWSGSSGRATERTLADEGPVAVFFAAEWGHRVRSIFGVRYAEWQLNLPYTYAALACLALPALWLIRRVRLRNRSPGLCPSCGYDLRATPGGCPECGQAPAGADA